MEERNLDKKTDTEMKKFRIPTSVIVGFVCILLLVTILLTYTLTSSLERKRYLRLLDEGKKNETSEESAEIGEKMQILANMIKKYSYYADSMSEEEMLQAAFRAYVAATGDRYAEFYTEEEYKANSATTNGSYCGIGVTVVRDEEIKDGTTYLVERVEEIISGGPADLAGVAIGDRIFSIEIAGVATLINQIGYEKATSAIQGEEGTQVSFSVFRGEKGNGEILPFTVTRAHVESVTVTGKLMEGTPKIGYVKVSAFKLNTPKQFKKTVNDLKTQGAEKFIFDMRDNPGGDLASIRAILSYFLEEGSLILETVDKGGNADKRYCAEEAIYTGDYADCSVTKQEIGMYRGIGFCTLCNENTASAAEVFVATMRDYGLAESVGIKTYGKGIMQTTRQISFGDSVAYVKLTTHAYLTKCGESYHGTGILPDHQVSGEEAQLQTAVGLFRK